MLRVLAAVPDATGLGLDTDEEDLARGRDNATLAEGEDFESGYQRDEEEWLAAHPDHPGAGLPDCGPGRLTETP